jgi:adenosylcobyric acid synthase
LREKTVRGYEIHMGVTTSNVQVFGDDGAQDDTGLVLGTYLHGLFHNDNFRSALLEYIHENRSRRIKGMCHNTPFRTNSERKTHADYDGDTFDELALVIQRHIDVEALYSIIGL